MSSRGCTTLFAARDETVVTAIHTAFAWICIGLEFTLDLEILASRASAQPSTKESMSSKAEENSDLYD